MDHLKLTDVGGVESAGFVKSDDGWFRHPGALLPAIQKSNVNQVMMRVDSVSAFVTANSHLYDFSINGEPLDQRRTAVFRSCSGFEFGVIERHGCTAACSLTPLGAEQKLQIERVREKLRHRQRHFGDEQYAYSATRHLVEHCIEDVGRDLTCALFFEGERSYWMSKNRAGRIQYMRQNALGLAGAIMITTPIAAVDSVFRI